MKHSHHADEYMARDEERVIVEELDREASRNGSLFALLACLAVAAGLALSAVVAMAATPVG